MLTASQTLELPIDHDRHTSAQCFTLFHTVKREKKLLVLKFPYFNNYTCDPSRIKLQIDEINSVNNGPIFY